MFSCRAKLYRYGKDVSAWKERGIGTLKILYNSDKGRSRILMRREVVHKICANHFITADMMLTEKKGTANAWIWNTFADYSEEVSKPEQLAVKFKTQDEFLLFKEKFEQCQKTSKKDASKVQGTATGPSEKSSNLMAKFAPKPGSWSCSVCLVPNEERTTVCVACGAAKLSDGATSSLTEAPKSGFQSTASGASNTGFSVLQGNPPSGSPFKFGKSGAETLNTSSGNSPFTFGTSDAGTLNTNSSNSPFTFGKSDSPFTFGKIDEATLNTSLTSSPFTFGAPPSDEDAVSDAESSEMPSTSKPPTTQPFVLAAFGIPAIASQSNPSTFTFGSSDMTGSSPFSFSMAEKPVSENVASAGETSAFGGASTQTDPLVCEKCEGDNQVTPNISQELQLTENQPQPSFSFGTPTSNQEIPEQKLFWQQATDGTTSWAEGVKAWHQATPSFMDSAKAQPQTASQISQLSSQPLTLPPQGAFTSNSRPEVKELLRRLIATKQQQDSVNQESQAGGYDFTPYVVDEPGEETTLQGAAKPISTVIVEECDNDDDEAIIDEYEESTDDSLSYTTTEGEDGEEEIEASLVPSSSKPQTQSSFSSSQGKVLTAPVKPVPIHSTQVENVGPANLPTHITGRRFLTVRSPLKGSKKQDDEDCVLVYEVRVSMADRDKASRLLLPSNFFNYRKYEACPGCFGCRGIVRKKETANLSKTEGKDKKDKPKLFWQQATGETTSWAEGVKAWHQATPPFMDSAKAQPQTAPQTSQLSSQPLTLPPQGAFTSNSRSKVNFYGSELLRRLVATKQQQDSDNQESQAGGYDFTPYVVDEPGEETTLQGAAKPISTVIVEVCDNDDDEAIIDEYEESTDDSLSYTTTEGEDGEKEIEASLVLSSSKPQTQSSFSLSQGKTFLDSQESPKGSKKQDDEDCVLVYEVRVSMADRDKASRLLLPSNFFNYRKYEACPGCFGCRGIVRKKETANLSNTEGKDKKDKPSPKERDAFPPAQKDSYKPFQGAGMQLFAEPSEDVEGQDNDKFHFEPVIPLPDEIQVVTGEEGLEVLFSERAKLYRFDADSGQWKERGVGDIKLLRHPTSSQGRVLMRRERIKKLCANHNINAGMELKPNIGSDRSWVWYTPADYSEGEARPEKLAIKFKSAEIAGRFKEVFNDLKESLSSEICPETEPTENEQGAGCALYNEFISTFAAAPTWTCKLCYVQNNAEDSKCIACDSVKTVVGSLEPEEEKSEFTATTINSSAIESIEPSTFQDLHEESTPAASIFQSPSVKGWTSSQLFTIGRGESSEDEADDEIYLSPSKTSSPSKLGTTLPQKPSTPVSHDSALMDLPFGTNTPAKFTFRLMASPGSPSPWKPMQLFSEPSLGEDVEGQDNDKLHFEPVIPLPDEIQVVTGEEGLEVLFSERAKLYRFDADSGQWKERGVGDIKLLRHPTSSQGRVLMRREQIKKLCANHNINAGMELKPNIGSDRSWVWYTPADYSEGEARPEKLAIKFKSAEIAGKFKEVFNDLKETLSSEICPETEPTENEQGAGCALYNEFISTFAAAPDTWTCELCYVLNNAEDSKCIACDHVKTVVGSLEPEEEKSEFTATTINPSAIESIEPSTFQDLHKESTPAASISNHPVQRDGPVHNFSPLDEENLVKIKQMMRFTCLQVKPLLQASWGLPCHRNLQHLSPMTVH
ncbi:E3 SUMO-protein ligase RanBP2 [Desmophyllum pertusum]|uniref:E3 SUMO-protein ligase RanBP2 n=1 Tax=Desmophyllum pertusum TaxID=174260 RepID=A0A9X0A4D7_9CNID|nr:E3 SUMO-protein ligase RanBP2 [Desmophyllum pertusum]